MEKIRGKTLKEWKEYCKSDNVPIKTTKYITCLEERIEALTIPVVVGQSEQLFCGVKSGFCPYEESDMKCRAEHKCTNQVAK